MKRALLVLAAVAAALPFAYATARGSSTARTTSICHRSASAVRPYVKLKVTAKQLPKYVKIAADIIPAPAGACPRSLLTATSGGTAATTTLTGEAENPAGDLVSTGSATIRLRAGQGQACFQLQADNLPSAAAAAHIHKGAVGTPGAVVVPLKTPDANGAASGCVAASRAVVKQILASPAGYYVNVHTAEFPGGAVRGQLAGTTAADAGWVKSVALSGANERPAGDPDGSGTAVIRIRQSTNQVCYRITVKNIVLPAVGAHIHKGPATGTGGIVVPFTAPGASGTSTACVTADPALIADIVANPSAYYANVHSTEFPGGAIRAQLG